MKFKYILILLTFHLFVYSCCKEDVKSDVKVNNKGEIISLPYLWKIPINKDGNWKNHNPPLENNMVFEGRVLIPTTNNSKSRNLSLISSENGEVIWNWSEWYQPETEGGNFTWYALKDDNLHWRKGTRLYTIDLQSGKTILRHRYSEDISFSSKFHQQDDIVYLMRRINNSNGFSTTGIFKGNIYSEEYQDILHLPYSKDSIGEVNRVRGADGVIPYSNSGIDYLVVKSSQPYKNWYYDQRVNLYNLNENKWVYTDVLAALPKQNNSGWMKVYKDNFYFTGGKEMFCYDILTGDQLWKREFPHDFTFSGFEIEGDIMVANCENAICYGINIKNGNILWQSEGSGTSSRLNNRILNKIAYFRGGGPAYFYAKDINTGKTIWKLDPYLFEENNAVWRNNVNVVPGKNGKKGKVIITSRRFAYCFEAAN